MFIKEIYNFVSKIKMKNKVIFFIVVVLSSSSAFSQSFELGVKLGVNNSKQSLRTDEATGIPGSQNKGIITNTIGGVAFKVKNLQGYHGGIYSLINFKIKEDAFAWNGEGTSLYLGIQPEIQYSLHGTKIIDSNNVIWSNKLYYINIPILLNLKIGKVSFITGPQISIVQDKKSSYERPKGLTNLSFNALANIAAFSSGSAGNFDMNSYSNRDVMFVTGFEIDLPLNLRISLRNLKGTRNVSKLDKETWKNSSWQLSFNYKFFKTKKKNKDIDN